MVPVFLNIAASLSWWSFCDFDVVSELEGAVRMGVDLEWPSEHLKWFLDSMVFKLYLWFYQSGVIFFGKPNICSWIKSYVFFGRKVPKCMNLYSNRMICLALCSSYVCLYIYIYMYISNIYVYIYIYIYRITGGSVDFIANVRRLHSSKKKSHASHRN